MPRVKPSKTTEDAMASAAESLTDDEVNQLSVWLAKRAAKEAQWILRHGTPDMRLAIVRDFMKHFSTVFDNRGSDESKETLRGEFQDAFNIPDG